MRISGNFFENYIQSCFKLLLLTLFLFSAGVIGGSFYLTGVPQEAEKALYGTFAGQAGLLSVADSTRVFRAAFLNLLQVWVLMSLSGTSCIGLAFAPLLVGLRGFLCGFAVSALVALYGARGIGAAAAGLLPQMLLLIPALQVHCAGAVCQIRRLAQTAERRQRRQLFFTYCIFCLLVLCVFALAAVYEGYVGWRLILAILT